MDGARIPYVYVLTPLTRIGAQRRTVMLGVDMERRTLLLGGFGLALALPVVGILFWLLSYFSLLAIPAAEAAVFYAFSRSRLGLKQTQWRTRMDRATSKSGQFLLCGRLIDPLVVKRGRIVCSTVPPVAAQLSTGRGF